MKRFVLLIFLVGYYLPAFAQNKTIDSLNKAVLLFPKMHMDYKKSKVYTLTLLDLAFEYVDIRKDTALVILKEAKQIAQQNQFLELEATAEAYFAIHHVSNNRMEQAIPCYKKAIELFRAGKATQKLSQLLRNCAGGLEILGRYTEAYSYVSEAYSLQSQMNEADKKKLKYHNTLRIMGDILKEMGELERAYGYYEEGYNFAKTYFANTIDEVFGALGYATVLERKKQDNALISLSQKCIRIIGNNPGLKYQPNLSALYQYLGDAFRGLKQNDSAKVNYEKSLVFCKKLNDLYNGTVALYTLSTLSLEEGNTEKALELAEEALQMNVKTNKRMDRKRLYELFTKIYIKRGESEKALAYQAKYIAIADSLNVDVNNREIGKIEAKYEFQKKEREFAQTQIIQELENKRLVSETEKQTLLASQSEQENKLLLTENEVKALAIAKQKQASLQQNKLFQAEKVRKELEAKQSLQDLAIQRGWIFGLVASLLALGIVLFLIGRNNRQKQKANKLLTYKNTEILQQKEEITTQAELLDSANKTKDQLFSIIAHDLRSPMVAFQSLNKQIQYFIRKNEPEKLQALGQKIENATNHINSLLNNLLQWAIVQKNMLALQPQNIVLHEAIEHTLEHFRWMAESQQITLTNEVGKADIIYTDSQSLQTILRNLISNALKFTPESGNICLAYQAQGRQGILSVSDTGVGMSVEKLQPLSPKLQLQTSIGVRGEKGVGIGLQLCYELAQQMGIVIEVQSTEGVGTVFRLVFSMDNLQPIQ